MPGKSKPGGGLQSSPIYKKPSAFTLRSGNSIGGRNGNGLKFKTMGGSPMRNDKGKTITGVERPSTATGKAWGQEGAVEAYEESTKGISSDMSKKDLRDYVLKTNKGKSATDSSRISMKSAIQLWRKKQELSKSDIKKSEIVKTGSEKKESEEISTPNIGEKISYEEKMAYFDWHGLRGDDYTKLSDERKAQIDAYQNAPWTDETMTQKVGYPKGFMDD